MQEYSRCVFVLGNRRPPLFLGFSQGAAAASATQATCYIDANACIRTGVLSTVLNVLYSSSLIWNNGCTRQWEAAAARCRGSDFGRGAEGTSSSNCSQRKSGEWAPKTRRLGLLIFPSLTLLHIFVCVKSFALIVIESCSWGPTSR